MTKVANWAVSSWQSIEGGGISILQLESKRIRQAKAAYTTRNVDLNAISAILRGLTPQSGDLVLAKIEQIGQHKVLELPNAKQTYFLVTRCCYATAIVTLPINLRL